MSTHSNSLAVLHHFADAEQQHESATLGMWSFLATEVLLFGGLFLAYSLFRYYHHDTFVIGSYELGIKLGLTNTIVLICSSLTMALAVHAAQEGHKGKLMGFLVLTMILGAAFMGIKAIEYTEHYHHNKVPGLNFVYNSLPNGGVDATEPVFHFLYFCMTGIHALHMVVGMGLLATILYMSWKDTFSPEYSTPVEMAGLYWHFVDIVWVFLFPLLYLTGLHYKGGGH
ncbi:MAG TPA: cytochrome c oxidase subunit 3 [Acidobacteriota bacterium]|nr:cytochrome c oxidase subunit 3 [Acidobacteriota bacterium]HNB69543.1 cytochrome c oxidase subunit 3 [Acidobacteriota bacterium]HNC42565.1 cytochrome c oxidase subunit 3 [Acidobacteriota bacterium]HND18281.1 cytochrome c oxidase subunit 3 [Acidobacteriota bacterium]HNG91551.1 cytochrome c oxidase subunit 3 [Acidobacteriota bacterium]